MRKKQLTVNTLALGNLKQRRKQYTILIIGIILAMVFSSSTLFFMFSSHETYREKQFDRYGKQHFIMSIYNDDESIFQRCFESVEKGTITNYGLAHIIGYGYMDSDARTQGFNIGWLDDKAKDISNQSFIEGSYPQNENEIALEQTAFLKLGTDAKIGDEITINLDIQDGKNYYGTTEKTYKLVGIVTDKRKNISYNSDIIPDAFVAQGTQTELGGKEIISAYIMTPYDAILAFRSDGIMWNAESAIIRYLYNNIGDDDSFWNEMNNAYQFDNFYSGITGGGSYIAVIAVVFIFVSCVAIVNAFNTNLKERKKQIGMLRAVGATKRQIIKIFGREALIICLISTPLSVAISYGIVKIAISFMNEKAVMTRSVNVLVASVVVCVIVTMLSALIPLLSATRITPMQAIRNIEITRKMNTKKIKSKKDFNVPSHLAKRNSKLYMGGKIAVSAMLIATIIFSCLGFSYFSYAKKNLSFFGWDYTLTNMGWSYNGDLANYKDDLLGMSEADEREIEAYPYFGEVVSQKRINSIFEVEEISDYFRCFQQAREILEAGVSGYYFKGMTADEMEKYINLFSRGKNIVNAPLYSFDQNTVKSLEDSLTAGKINLDKLASGEEIILLAPQSAKYSNHINDDGAVGEVFYDDEAVDDDIEILYEGVCPFSVGDKINISVLEYTKDSVEDELSASDYIRTEREVTVGAIVNPEKFWTKFKLYHEEFGFVDFSFLTVHNGMNAFCKTAKYGEFYINTDSDIKLDDETDTTITELMTAFEDKYSGYFESGYAEMKKAEDKLNLLVVEILSIVLIGFVVCAAIINNSLTASIREKKKEIGTLRAVGADIKVLVNSYIRQLLSMLGIGYGAGFAAFSIIYALMAIISNVKKEEFEYVFSPWETLAFCLILFAICSFNLWSKVRKEMKNSIVDNIREL